MLKKYIKNEKGMALALVIMVFAVVIIVASTALSISLSQITQSVSTERYEENYYYARSATDTVSTDLINMIDDLYQQSQLLAANPSPSALEVAQYASSRESVEKILEGGNIVVSGIGKKDIVSTITKTTSNGATILEIESVYENEGRSSKAKVRLGSITKAPLSLTMNGTSSAIHSWGKMEFGETPVILDGDITYGESLQIKKSTTTEDAIDLPIYTIDIPTVASITASALLNNSSTTITSANNGYHGDLSFINSLVVNTTSGDVILGFSRMYLGNNATITVNGSGNLYIYLFENAAVNYGKTKIGNKNTDPYIFNVGNNFEISNGDASDIPKTYIVSKMIDQDSPNYIASIGNATKISAYFYLPGVQFVSLNTASKKIDFTGAIWASDIKMGNNLSLKYKKPNKLLSVVDESGSTTITEETLQMEGFDLGGAGDSGRLWIK